MAADPVLASSTEDVTHLRDSVNDLVSVMAQPALWAGGKLPDVVSRVLDALIRGTNDLIAANERLTTELAQQRATAAALRANELSFQLTVDSIPGMVHTMTVAGGVEFVNHQILDYFGKTIEELHDWQPLVHPDDRSRVVEGWLHSVETGEPFDVEHRVLAADGTYRWMHSRGLPLRDLNGNIVRWYNLLTDVDERKRAEQALRDSEYESRLIVETIPGFVAMMSPDGEVDFVNRRLVEYCGQPLTAMREWGTNGTVHAEDLPHVATLFGDAIRSGEPYDFEARIRRFDGVYRWFQVRGLPLRDTSERIVRWYVLLADIDERKRAETELRRAYDSFADAQRLSKTGSFITDLMGDDHTWSDEAYRIFEFDLATKITVQRVRDVVHPDDLPTFESVIARGMTGVDVTFAFRIVTARGAVKHLRGVAHVRELVDGRPMFIGALQDVTESMVAEEALSKARSELAHVARVTTMNALTASIAHEVNQPLAGIITNAGTCLRMLAGDRPDIEGARETARRTIRDANRASDVITRLRALFSRKEFTLEPLDLNEAMREVIALSWSDLQRNRVVLQADLADDLPIVTGDRIQLQQVVLNLLRNAADAMVDVHDRPRQLLVKTARDDGDQVRVTVRDVGVGLDLQGMDSLFDAFYTTKSGGMGIGLFVSRSIVERHHGRLWAQPNDGPGATFSFSIPLALRGLPDSPQA
jgi:PAS domain S-box-containing protein